MTESPKEPAAIGTNPSRWVDEHGDALYRFALVRLRNAELAEDMVQETFIAALKGLASFRGGSSERTWLIGILKRKIIDHYRRRWREQPISQLAASEQEEGSFNDLFDRKGHWKGAQAAWSGNPRERLNDKEFFEVLQGCLGRLPGRQGEAFVLRELEAMDSQEICQVLNVTATNLWALLHRARVRLRECLTQNWFGKRAGR
jgi:RNA polymerase sigma-70 factor (ECF subfamily)